MAEERVISYQKVSEKGANSVQSPEKRGKDSGGLSDTDIASIAILSTMAVGILTLTAEHVGFRMGKSYFVPEKKAEGIELIELNRRQKTYKIYAVRDGKRKILTIDYTDRAKAQRVLMDAGFSSSLAFDILDVKEPFATIEGPFKRSATRIGKAFMAAFIPFQPVLQLSKIAITGPASILINAGTEAYESWKKAPNVLLKPAEAIGGAVKGAVSAPISMVTTSAVAGFYAVPREYMRIIQRQNPAAIKKAYRK